MGPFGYFSNATGLTCAISMVLSIKAVWSASQELNPCFRSHSFSLALRLNWRSFPVLSLFVIALFPRLLRIHRLRTIQPNQIFALGAKLHLAPCLILLLFFDR